jgi:hypothetical protein
LGHRPLQVRSCWNGIVAFRARAFHGPHARRFRALPDSLAARHLEASECCLVHADAPAGHGVWLNPAVRVAYSQDVYRAVNPAGWPSPAHRIWGVWAARLTLAALTRWSEEYTVRTRTASWRADLGAQADRLGAEDGLESVDSLESAEFCIVDEMQVLEGAGWRHL